MLIVGLMGKINTQYDCAKYAHYFIATRNEPNEVTCTHGHVKVKSFFLTL